MPISPPVLTGGNGHTSSTTLPSFGIAIMPILLPLLLIVLASISAVVHEGRTDALTAAIAFLGNKNVAMFLGLVVALWLWAKHKNLGLKRIG